METHVNATYHWSNISNTSDSVSSGCPNNKKIVEKRRAAESFWRNVRIADETHSRVFDRASQSKQKLRSKQRNEMIWHRGLSYSRISQAQDIIIIYYDPPLLYVIRFDGEKRLTAELINLPNDLTCSLMKLPHTFSYSLLVFMAWATASTCKQIQNIKKWSLYWQRKN